ncbi:MAG: hypothetical protein Q7K28_01955 [Candidatus Wildermuthbacteria bacterium]|nr:hypothetical protein [Candidatus Wildermuthbacteria bacterium]
MLVLFSILAVLVVPIAVSAQVVPQECCKLTRKIEVGGEICTGIAGNNIVGAPGATCPGIGAINCPTAAGTEKWGIFCIFNVISVIVDWFFVVMVILAVLFSILGAFNLLIGAGEPQKVTAGRNYIQYAAIGLIVGLIARAIPGIVKSVMGY